MIYEHGCEYQLLDEEVEVEESYFWVKRKGKHGQGAASKVPVFRLLKRNSRFYTAMIPNAKIDTLLPIIRKKVKPV